VRLKGLDKLKKIHLFGIRTRDLPSCSIVPQPTALPHAPASSGVQIVVFKNSAAHCNAVFFPPILVASGYFGYVGYYNRREENRITASSRILVHNTCTPEDGQLGRNMCPVKEYEERIVNDVALRRHKNFRVRFVVCFREPDD
jgi:hypothetical protein